MGIQTLYNLSTAAWLAVQAFPSLLAPRLTITLLQSTVDDRTLRPASDLELYYVRATAFAQTALAVLLLTLCIPALQEEGALQALSATGIGGGDAGSSGDRLDSSSAAGDSLQTLRRTLPASTVYNALACFHAYGRFVGRGGALLGFAAAVDGVLAALGAGLWLFGGEEARAKGSAWVFGSREERKKRRKERKGL